MPSLRSLERTQHGNKLPPGFQQPACAVLPDGTIVKMKMKPRPDLLFPSKPPEPPAEGLCWKTVLRLCPYLRLHIEALKTGCPPVHQPPPVAGSKTCPDLSREPYGPERPPVPEKKEKEEKERVELSWNPSLGTAFPLHREEGKYKPETEAVLNFDLNVPVLLRRRAHLTFHILAGAGSTLSPKQRFLFNLYLSPEFSFDLSKKWSLGAYARPGLVHERGEEWSAVFGFGIEAKFRICRHAAYKFGLGGLVIKPFSHEKAMILPGFETGFEFIMPDLSRK